jgi:DNA repair photolyase
MEQDALNDLLQREERRKYKHFMRKEPVVRESDIQVDADNGMRFEMRDIGMVRNDKHPKLTKVFLDPTPHILLDSPRPLQGWYQPKSDPGHRPRPCFTEAVLTQPYGGRCEISCGFCYINSGTRGYRGQDVTTVPINYGAFVAKSLSKMKTSAAGYFSSFTEPFQRLEDIYHNTQQGAQAFVDEGLPIFFLSRRAYPSWAYDMLRKNAHSYAQKSINTPDSSDWRKLSPNAIGLQDTIEEVTALHKAGIYVSIQVNPIIAGVTTNDQIVELIHILAKAGADHLIFKFAEIAYPSRAALTDIMVQQFGERGKVFKSLMTCNIGHQATIDEQYRLTALERFSKECKRAHVTMATCYEYAFGRNSDHVIVDRVGESIGKKYLTADQCHGHAVPMYTRESTDDPFLPMEECPPSGCLHCADDSPDGKGACGSAFMGSAPALEFKDMKVSPRNDDRPAFTTAPPLVQITRRSLV